MSQTKESDYDTWLRQLIRESADLDEIESAMRVYMRYAHYIHRRYNTLGINQAVSPDNSFKINELKE